jgi:hypothetical protein
VLSALGFVGSRHDGADTRSVAVVGRYLFLNLLVFDARLFMGDIFVERVFVHI